MWRSILLNWLSNELVPSWIMSYSDQGNKARVEIFVSQSYFSLVYDKYQTCIQCNVYYWSLSPILTCMSNVWQYKALKVRLDRISNFLACTNMVSPRSRIENAKSRSRITLVDPPSWLTMIYYYYFY